LRKNLLATETSNMKKNKKTDEDYHNWYLQYTNKSNDAPEVKKGRKISDKITIIPAWGELEVKATREQLKFLERLYWDSQEEFSRLFYHHFIQYPLWYIRNQSDSFYDNFKRDTAWVYCYVKYWVKKKDAWEPVFRNIIKKLSAGEYDISSKRKQYNEAKITFSIMSNVNKYDLKDRGRWDNDDGADIPKMDIIDFQRDYLTPSGNRFLKRAESATFKTHGKTSRLVPLEGIFSEFLSNK